MRKAIMVTVILNNKNQVARIAAWQSAQTDLIHSGGLVESSWDLSNSFLLVNTYIDCAYGIRQDGTIKRITMFADGNVAWKFKVFRRTTGTTFAMVSETPLAVTDHGGIGLKYTYDVSIPVQMGDVVGVFTPTNGRIYKRADAAILTPMRYSSGDVTTPTSFTNTNIGHLDIEIFTTPPYVAFTGDSILAGHGGVTPWHAPLENLAGDTVVPGGLETSEPPNQLRAKIGDGTVLQYQNLCVGSQTFAWVASTGIVAAHAVKPHTIIVHCGFNDVLAGRAWADIEANLNTIKAAITTERLMIDEILPSSNLNDTQAATVRTFNANLATWCATNGARLISTWSRFGQLRASTGFNDDCIAALFQDGTHLSAAGADLMADIHKSVL